MLLRISILASLFLASSYTIFGQIPNGSFEDWELIDTFQNPVGWETNIYSDNDEGFYRFEMDTSAAEGNFSLKTIYDSNNVDGLCGSSATTSITFDSSLGNNKSFYCFVKTIPDDSGFGNAVIQIKLYNDSQFLWQHVWSALEPLLEFTEVEIPLMYSEADSIVIKLTGGAGSGANGCVSVATTWFDYLRIEANTIISTTETESFGLNIFPNPANENITVILDNNFLIKDLRVYNVHGQEMFLPFTLVQNSIKIDINDIPIGLYFIQAEQNGNLRKGKFVKLNP